MRLIPSEGFMYLASPYSHPDAFVREERYLRTMHAMTEFLKLGIAIYSPIVHCHELAKVVDLPRDAAFWRKYNFTMLAAAEMLWVLMLPGWEESVGIQEEHQYAVEEAHIPVIHFEERSYHGEEKYEYSR